MDRGDLLAYRLTHRHAFRRCDAGLIILKRESRSEDMREERTVPWDEMFIRASPAILSHTMPPSATHTHTHTLRVMQHLPPTHRVQSACSSGPQQIVNNEWFFYKSRCVAVEALSVLGQPASLHSTAFSLLLLLLAGQPLLNALPKALQCRPRDCWLLSPGKYCALSRNLSTPVDITAEAFDSRGQAKCRVSS